MSHLTQLWRWTTKFWHKKKCFRTVKKKSLGFLAATLKPVS
jgi:hypothetical protein